MCKFLVSTVYLTISWLQVYLCGEYELVITWATSDVELDLTYLQTADIIAGKNDQWTVDKPNERLLSWIFL